MKRLLTSLLLAALALPVHAVPATRHVDLNRPQALADLQRDNPTHYRIVTQILRDAPTHTPASLSGWMRTAFHADIASVMPVKTSYPPKAQLRFRLDDTAYSAQVTLKSTPEVRHAAE